MPVAQLVLDEPHAAQEAMLRAEARWKVLNWGRRTGKTNGLFTMAMCGHGGAYDRGRARWQGALHGWDVVWFTIDYGQAQTVWNEEIRDRFEGIPGATVNNSIFSGYLPGGGGLHIRSAERPKVARGFGKRLKGVIYDEGAHYDALGIHTSIIRPALMDNEGWATFGSSPNAASDGNKDGAGGTALLPSGFNRRCEAILRGEFPDWFYSHATARDNPSIDPTELQSLVAEYTVGSVKYQQEIEAKLLRSGAGYAFPEWRADLHVGAFYPDATLAGWHWYAGLDWGYTAKGVFVLYARGPDQQTHVRWDWAFSGKAPYEAGFEAGTLCQRRGTVPQLVGADAAMGSRTGLPTHLESFRDGWAAALGKQAEHAQVIAVAKVGQDSRTPRQHRKMLLHDALRWQAAEDGVVYPWGAPRLTFHPDARECVATIPQLVLDPHDTEDVDTDGDDHAYDGLTYGLQLRPVGPRLNARPPARDRWVAGPDGRRVTAGIYQLTPPAPRAGFRFQRGRAREV